MSLAETLHYNQISGAVWNWTSWAPVPNKPTVSVDVLGGSAGLLTPLIFARHRLSPLAVLLPVRTFFKIEGGDSEFANFTLPTLKACFEARSKTVSGNKHYLVARAIGCPKTHFFPHELTIFWSARKDF